MQNHPDEAAKPVSHHADGLIVPQASHMPAVEDLEYASFVFNRRVGRLIENAAHVTVALRGSVAAAYSGALVVTGACADP